MALQRSLLGSKSKSAAPVWPEGVPLDFRWVSMFDTMFLGTDEQKEYEDLVASDDEKLKWLEERSIRKLEPLWYFMVSLCRLLQSDDFDLSPKDAYWLGLIDEIPGSDLPNLRVMLEHVPESPVV